MCSLSYAMTANKTYLSTYFPFKTSLFIKRMSLINKVNFKKCFSENYKRMRLTTRVYGISISYRYILRGFHVELNGLYPSFIAQSMRDIIILITKLLYWRFGLKGLR